MSQPPLSQGLKRLESHLGVRLFERDATGVRLTAAGERIVPKMSAAIESAEEIVSNAGQWAPKPELRLGLAGDVEDRANALIVSLVALDIPVSPILAGSSELIQRIKDGDLDVALVRHPAVVDGADARPVFTIPQTLISARGPIAPGRTDLPVIVPPRRWQPAAHDQLVDSLRRYRHPGTTIEEPDLQARRALLAAERVVTLADAPWSHSGNVPVFPLGLRVVLPVPSDRRRGLPHEEAAARLEASLL